MGLLRNLMHSCRKVGIKESLSIFGKNYLGINNQQEEIDTLFYFLTLNEQIQKIAKGVL